MTVSEDGIGEQLHVKGNKFAPPFVYTIGRLIYHCYGDNRDDS